MFGVSFCVLQPLWLRYAHSGELAPSHLLDNNNSTSLVEFFHFSPITFIKTVSLMNFEAREIKIKKPCILAQASAGSRKAELTYHTHFYFCSV